MFALWQLPILILTTLYQAIACYQENQQRPPGQLIDVGGYRLHLLHLPAQSTPKAEQPTIVIDHSLGGVEGYLLVKEISRMADVCMCDRAGYGWSDPSLQPATSLHSIKALDKALTQANIKPPYILVGNSLGSYNIRLYAHRYPQKVAGLVLTDGLHEKALLTMPFQLRLLQLLFGAGFVMSIFGSALGFIRIAAKLGSFERIKPQLKHMPIADLHPVVRSFCRPKHWLTMAREIANLDKSGRQLKPANDFGKLPIVNIKAKAFFTETWLTKWLPLGAVEEVRSQMHKDLMQLSKRCTQLPAEHSSHFVWIDQPEIIVQAIELILLRTTAIPSTQQQNK